MTHLSTGHDVPVAIFCGFRPFLEDLRYGGTADEVAKVADATQNHLLEHGRLADISGLYYKNWTSVIDADAARSVMKTLESSDAASVIPCIIKQYFLVVTTLLNLRSSFCCQRYQ